MKRKEGKKKVNVPGSDMGFGREEDKSRILVLRSDLVIPELFNEFRPSYHFLKPEIFFSDLRNQTLFASLLIEFKIVKSSNQTPFLLDFSCFIAGI